MLSYRTFNNLYIQVRKHFFRKLKTESITNYLHNYVDNNNGKTNMIILIMVICASKRWKHIEKFEVIKQLLQYVYDKKWIELSSSTPEEGRFIEIIDTSLGITYLGFKQNHSILIMPNNKILDESAGMCKWRYLNNTEYNKLWFT